MFSLSSLAIATHNRRQAAPAICYIGIVYFVNQCSHSPYGGVECSVALENMNGTQHSHICETEIMMTAFRLLAEKDIPNWVICGSVDLSALKGGESDCSII